MMQVCVQGGLCSALPVCAACHACECVIFACVQVHDAGVCSGGMIVIASLRGLDETLGV